MMERNHRKEKDERRKTKDEIVGEEQRRQNKGGRLITRKKERWKGKSGTFKKGLTLWALLLGP